MGRFEVVSTIPKPITISLCCLLKDKENMRAKISSLEKDIAKMKKEGHKRKKLLMDQQQLIDAGADNFHKVLSLSLSLLTPYFLHTIAVISIVMDFSVSCARKHS